MTDESCPDIESDSECMVSQQTIPWLMQIRNPSQRREQSPNIRMNNQAFSYV